jgi:hypothetical protein
MPSITSFTRPPHYEIRDVEAAGHLEVTRRQAGEFKFCWRWFNREGVNFRVVTLE